MTNEIQEYNIIEDIQRSREREAQERMAQGLPPKTHVTGILRQLTAAEIIEFGLPLELPANNTAKSETVAESIEIPATSTVSLITEKSITIEVAESTMSQVEVDKLISERCMELMKHLLLHIYDMQIFSQKSFGAICFEQLGVPLEPMKFLTKAIVKSTTQLLDIDKRLISYFNVDLLVLPLREVNNELDSMLDDLEEGKITAVALKTTDRLRAVVNWYRKDNPVYRFIALSIDYIDNMLYKYDAAINLADHTLDLLYTQYTYDLLQHPVYGSYLYKKYKDIYKEITGQVYVRDTQTSKEDELKMISSAFKVGSSPNKLIKAFINQHLEMFLETLDVLIQSSRLPNANYLARDKAEVVSQMRTLEGFISATARHKYPIPKAIMEKYDSLRRIVKQKRSATSKMAIIK